MSITTLGMSLAERVRERQLQVDPELAQRELHSEMFMILVHGIATSQSIETLGSRLATILFDPNSGYIGRN